MTGMDGAVTLLAVLPQLVVQHMGALHPFEKALTLVLAFGPFLLLAVVVLIRRRQDAADDPSEGAAGDPVGEDDRAGAGEPPVAQDPER